MSGLGCSLFRVLLTCTQIWNLAIRGGVFVLEHIKRMHHLDSVGYNVGSAMTAVLPLANRVYTGDEDGRVVSRDSEAKLGDC